MCGCCSDCSVCCYVACCPCCAAGDVAQAANRDYCMSCFVIPFFLPIAWPCFRACDREALTKAHNIDDGIGYCCACLLSWIGLGGCLLCQELITIKQQQLGGPRQPLSSVVIVQAPTQVAMQPGACHSLGLP